MVVQVVVNRKHKMRKRIRYLKDKEYKVRNKNQRKIFIVPLDDTCQIQYVNREKYRQESVGDKINQVYNVGEDP